MGRLLEISSDYWNSFIQVSDENSHSIGQQGTPDHGNAKLGAIPRRPTSRRRSQLFRIPLQSRYMGGWV